MADANFRLLLILQKIPRAPQSISTQSLRQQLLDDGYEVTLRTIQRDLEKLSSKFALVQTQPTGRGKTGVAWSFTQKSANQGFPSMNPSAALTLLMGLKHLQQILPPQILDYLEPLQIEAQQTLENLHQGAYGQWLDKVRVVPQQILQPPAIEQNALEAIYQALLNGKQFIASYAGKAEQTIHPYGLVQRGNTFYLLCRFFDFDDVRITALHRFTHVQLLDKKVRDFPEFDIDNYLDTGVMRWPIKGNKTIALKLRVDKWLYGHLKEAKLHERQHIIEDENQTGFFIVEADVVDSHELRWWLLSQGSALQVLKPKTLRDWFADQATKLSLTYQV